MAKHGLYQNAHFCFLFVTDYSWKKWLIISNTKNRWISFQIEYLDRINKFFWSIRSFLELTGLQQCHAYEPNGIIPTYAYGG